MSNKRLDGTTYSSDGETGTWDTDLLTDNWDSLSLQLNYTQAEATNSFIDGAKASGTITITSYAAAHLTTATPSGTIAFGTPDEGDTVRFDNFPTDDPGSSITFTYVAAAPGANEFSDADELAALINGLTDVSAVNVAGTITLTAQTAGAAMNDASVHGTGTWAALVVTFSGGVDAAVVTVAGHDLVESVDWDSVTNNNTAADNLAAAIDALSEVTAANPAAAIITVKAATIGEDGNTIDTVLTAGAGVTVQQATLAGGLDSDINDTDDEVTIVGHGYESGDKVNFDKLTGTVPTGLTDNTDYWMIAIDEDTIAFADSYAHAIAGTKIDITGAAAGGGSFTLTPVAISGTITLYASNDGENWVALSTPTPVTFSTNSSTLWESVDVTCRYLRVSFAVAQGKSVDASFKVNAKGEAQ